MAERTIAAPAVAIVALGLGFAGRWLCAGPETGTPPPAPPEPFTVTALPVAPKVFAGAPKRTEHPPVTLLPAFVAATGGRPLTVLRYLEDPSGLEEVRALARLLATTGEKGFKDAAAQVLFARWVELDPRDALEFANGLGRRYGHSRRDDFLMRFFHVWHAMDKRSALAALGEERTSIGRTILRYLTPKGEPDREADAVEGAQGARAALAIADPSARLDALRESMNQWRSGAPLAAFEFALGIEGAHERQLAMGLTAYHAGKIDPDTVIANLLDEPRSRWRTGVLCSIIKDLAKKDSATASAWIARVPGGVDHQAAAMAVLPTMAEGDLDAAINLLESVDWELSSVRDITTWKFNGGSGPGANYLGNTPQGREIAAKILLPLVKTDVRRALDIAGRISFPNGWDPIGPRAKLLEAVRSEWSKFDQAASLEWLANMPAHQVQSQIALTYRNRSYRWAGETRAHALAFIAKLGSAETRASLTEEIVQAAGHDEIREIPAIAGPLPDDMQARIDLMFLESRAQKNPREVAAEVPSLPEIQRAEAFHHVLMYLLSDEGPAAAAAFLGDYSEQDLVVPEHHLVARSWARREPDAAEAWVRSLELGTPRREQAVAGFVESIQRSRGDAHAFEWALTHTDREMQEKTLSRVVFGWTHRDPAAARAALAAAAIPAELKARLGLNLGLPQHQP